MENTIQNNAVPASQSAGSKPVATAAKPLEVSTKEVAADIEKVRNEASQAIALSANEVKQAAESLRLTVKRVEPALKITVDDAVDIPVVTVVDQGSNKVIRQIPNEEVVALARFMESQNFDDYSSKSAIRGILLDDRG
jgi:flagellar protein FlaG